VAPSRVSSAYIGRHDVDLLLDHGHNLVARRWFSIFKFEEASGFLIPLGRVRFRESRLLQEADVAVQDLVPQLDGKGPVQGRAYR